MGIRAGPLRPLGLCKHQRLWIREQLYASVYAPATVALSAGRVVSGLVVASVQFWFHRSAEVYGSLSGLDRYVRNVNVTHVNITNINVTNALCEPECAGAVTVFPKRIRFARPCARAFV